MNAVLDGSKENASIGGMFGVLKGDDVSGGSYTGNISDITVEGRIDGTLDNITDNNNNQSGTGGVAGSLYINSCLLYTSLLFRTMRHIIRLQVKASGEIILQ